MSQLKAYPEYKDSKNKFIEEIPSNWKKAKLKRYFKITSSKRVFEKDWKSEGIPFYRARDISHLNDPSYLPEIFISEEHYYENISLHGSINVGDIIVTAVGTLGEVLLIRNHKPFYFKDGNIIWFKKEGEIEGEFVRLLFETPIIKEQIKYNSNTTTVGTLTIDNAKNFEIPVPSTKEQKSISNYLNKKTTEIDNLISDKERLIELLEEKRQTVITETVTKGLNPDVKMKDSGIEWIGDIPEHWNKTKLKYLSKETAVYGLNESAESYSDYGIRLLRTTDIHENGKLKEKGGVYINIKKVKHTSNQILNKNDILFSRSGTIGRTYIHQTYEKMTFASYLVKFSFNNTCYPLFIYYFTQGHNFIGWLNSVLVSSTISNVNGNRYANMPIVIPSYNEQVYISKYLTKEIKKINILIKDIKLQISRLKKYRESLIYEAVTGKIDVRDYVTEEAEVY